MRLSRRVLAAGLLVTASLLSPQAVATAAPQKPAVPTPAPVPAPAPESELGNETSIVVTAEPKTRPGEFSTAAVCSATTRGDNVHRSSTGFAASGHGWWVNVNCSATQADVTVQLQQYYSDGVWRNRGSAGAERVYSGGGSGNRANARAVCADSRTTGWRSVVDVDLVGLIDDSSVLITPSVNISCRRS